MGSQTEYLNDISHLKMTEILFKESFLLLQFDIHLKSKLNNRFINLLYKRNWQ